MASVERCICCGEIIPEGRSVCPNCLVATKEMEIRKKHKKHCTEALRDLWCNFLCGLLLGMTIVGFWVTGLLVVFNVAGEIVGGWWCAFALLGGSVMLALGILRYLGRSLGRK